MTIDLEKYPFMKERLFDGDYIELDRIKYCPYCGKRLEGFDNEYHYDSHTYYNCDCEDSIKAYQISIEIARLQHQLPKRNFHVRPQIVKI